MNLYVYQDHHLREMIRHSLFPGYVKDFFLRALFQNGIDLTTFMSDIFNIGYLSGYTKLTIQTATEYEIDVVAKEFFSIAPKIESTPDLSIYSIDMFSTIFRLSGYEGEYHGFTSEFHEYIYDMLVAVGDEHATDYHNDILAMCRFLVERVECHFVRLCKDNEQTLYVAATLVNNQLWIFVR